MSAAKKALAALVILPLVGCADSAPPDPPAGALGALRVYAPSARLAGGTGAVYLRIENAGAADDRLQRVETASAALAETHETVEQSGVMRMSAHPDGFVVPAGGTLELRPGGKHVMLIEPRPDDHGGAIPLTLVFERAGRLELRVPIAEP